MEKIFDWATGLNGRPSELSTFPQPALVFAIFYGESLFYKSNFPFRMTDFLSMIAKFTTIRKIFSVLILT